MNNRDFAVLLLSMLLFVGGASVYVATYDTDYEVTYGGTDEVTIDAVTYESLSDARKESVDTAMAEGTIVVEDDAQTPPTVVEKEGQAHVFMVKTQTDFGEAQNGWHPIGGLVALLGVVAFFESLRREYRPYWKPWRRLTDAD